MHAVSRRRSALVVVLVLLVAGSGWALRELGLDLLGPVESSRHAPDLFIEDFASMYGANRCSG